MSDVDPFGRKQGEDSLKEMGWSLPSATPAPAAAPAASPPISSPPPSSPITPTTAIRRRRTGGGVGVARVIIPILVLAGIGIGVGSAVTGVKHAVDSIPSITFPSIAVPTIPSTGSSPTPAQPGTPPTGLAAGSLLRPAGLRTAIARLRPLGRLYHLRVAPERVNAQLVRGTTLRITQLSSDGTVIRNDVANAGGVLGTFPWARVNALAPTRIVRGAHRRPSTVDYLVLSDFAGTPSWDLYLKDGTHYSAGADGRHVRRIG
jgi:hypothetical protein